MYTAYVKHTSRAFGHAIYSSEADAVRGLLAVLIRKGFLDPDILGVDNIQTSIELRDLLHRVGDPVYTNQRNGYSFVIKLNNDA